MTRKSHSVKKKKTNVCFNTKTNMTTKKPRKKSTAPRRFAIDIGKTIALAMMFDPRSNGDGGGE